MKKLCLRLCLMVVPLGIIAITNYCVDPAGLFVSSSQLYGYARDVAGGKWLIVDKGLDQKALKRVVIALSEIKPRIVLMGSSRSMEVRSEFLGKTGFYNMAVPNGGFKEYINYYSTIIHKEVKPSVVVLEMSVFTLPPELYSLVYNSENELNELGLKKYIPVDLTKELIGFSTQDSRYYALFSPAYFQSAARRLIIRKKSDLVAQVQVVAGEPTDLPEANWLIAPDGRVGYEPYRNCTLQSARANAKDWGILYTQSYKKNPEPMVKSLFVDFIKRIQQDGCRVIFFIPPYHPIAYEMFKNSENQNLINSEAYYRSVAEKYNIHIIGSYDPVKSGCDENDFYDFHHLKPEGVRRMFESHRKIFVSQ